MTKMSSASVVEVTADTPEALERDLNAAVDVVCRQAMQMGRHGVMVTRHNYASFTVAISEVVPYGQTQERQQWQPTS
ncbi:hypothetical protein OOZ51_22135 [Arthrobacter sp. MI7-26]|uniref:hypothetical protein n=1 Tax=Arthrobacter sp. MI7-26 TaxID=2993653 RepID=UPI0022493F3B|nr:hypothetical protein [Arthrobacter sp. MI7-26]MCX2750482.1 hypothetical protein [Arthrobacter sp. MI7-26]